MAVLGRFIHEKVSIKELAVFTWLLYTCIDAGIPLVSGINMISKQVKNKCLREVLGKIEQDVKKGKSFSDSLQKYPYIFSSLYVRTLRAGEIGGAIETVLYKLASYLEQEADTQAQIKAAVTYPVLLLSLSIGAVIFLISFVLPRFALLFEDIGGKLPFITVLLLNLGRISQQFFFPILAGIAAVLFTLGIYVRTKNGRWIYDNLKLKLPIIGVLLSKLVISRFTRLLSILISGGVPLLTSLEVVEETIGNVVFVNLVEKIRKNVKEGRKISDVMAKSNIIPPITTGMITIGEATGKLEGLLKKIADFYDREVDEAIKLFTKLLEPILIMVMTVIVGFIVTSIFLPMADLLEQIK